MQRSCRECQGMFEVTEEDLAFYEKISPVFGGKRILIPSPTLCPECRSRRRMVWRNERSLALRVCELCGKSKVSMFPLDSRYHTYCHDCFYSDGWNALTYGREYDFSKTFRSNMETLLHDMPLMMLYQSGANENCEYTNYFGPDSRNCYLIYNSGRDEDCSYSRGLIESKSCIDMLIGNGNQFCYECVNASSCYTVFFSQNIAQCSDSAFLFNCRRCRHCFGCTNLVEKEYHLFNRPCTSEEYSLYMARLASASFVAEMQATFADLQKHSIHRENSNINTEQCTGDYLTDSKNCIDCYEVKGAEDCTRLLCSKLCKDSHDLFGYGYDSQLLYDCVGVGLSTSVAFSWICTSVADSLYCIQCDHLEHCFGCISLRHKKYCLLNKQYSREEYEALVAKIIESMVRSGEWGEFLPSDVSPFAYNETVAQEFLPLTKSQATTMNFRWNDLVSPPLVSTKTSATLLPDSIAGVSDDILNDPIQCEKTGKAFRLTKQELEFYRTLHLPIPRVHPDERHIRRMNLRNPCRLWNRSCAKCQKPIATSYSPERPEIVYCESCYLEAIY